MGKWKEVSVNDVADSIQYGYTGKTIETGKYRYLRITDIQNQNVDWESVPLSDINNPKEIEKYLLKENDIVFARTGATVGKSFLIKEVVPSVFASYLIRIQPNKKVFPEFLYLYFQSEDYWQQIRGHEVGAAQPNVNGKKLGVLRFPLPPIEVQQQIVTKLDALFERIDKSIALLEQNIEHTKDLMASVLDEEFSNGDTPISKVCTLKPKKSEAKALLTDDDMVSFLPMVDLNEKQIDFIPQQEKALKDVSGSYTYFKDGDVLLAKVTPCFENGKAGIAKNLTNGIGFGSSEIHTLRPNGKALAEWLYFAILSNRFVEHGVRNFTGSSGLKRVPIKVVGDYKIPVPPIEEQKVRIEKIKSLQLKLNSTEEKLTEKIKDLKALKSSLLDKAFKGELV